MPYDCIVLAKQVPDTHNITGQAMKEDGTVNRAALPAIFNPEDLNALEMALAVREAHGGTVTVITMGPPAAAELLRDSLYRGADRVILLTDRKFAAADTLATSYALSCAIRKAGRFDLVFCGRQAIDGDTAQVGPQTAEKLGLPQVTYVVEIRKISKGAVEAVRDIGQGFEVVKCQMPCLMTVTGSANTPRPQSAKRIMQFKRATCASEVAGRVRAANNGAPKEEVDRKIQEALAAFRAQPATIIEWDAAAAGAEDSKIGAAGSPTKVKKIESVVLAGKDLKRIEPNEGAVRQLVRELIEDHILG
ncbi:MAG TPA: electron transfer flavoprotein subunit beta/FixA family protein [Candidatus Brocadiia bacterium]|nr:electron transfer flavoprotein subunit beta/FixA family protein [Candidatus Brocadiia bacterium]